MGDTVGQAPEWPVSAVECVHEDLANDMAGP